MLSSSKYTLFNLWNTTRPSQLLHINLLICLFIGNETERKKQLVHKKNSLKLIITLYTGDGSELSVSIQDFLNKSFKALKMHIFLLIIF